MPLLVPELGDSDNEQEASDSISNGVAPPPRMSAPFLLGYSERIGRHKYVRKLIGACVVEGVYQCTEDDIAAVPELGLTTPEEVIRWVVSSKMRFDNSIEISNDHIKPGTGKALRLRRGMPENEHVQRIFGDHGEGIVLMLPEIQAGAFFSSRTCFFTTPQCVREAGLLNRVLPPQLTGNARLQVPAVDHLEAREAQAPEDMEREESKYYPVDVIVSALRIVGKLRSPNHFGSVVRDSLSFARHVRGEKDVLAEENELPCPSRWSLARWEIKLDLLTMLFRRWEWDTGRNNHILIFWAWTAHHSLGTTTWLSKRTSS